MSDHVLYADPTASQLIAALAYEELGHVDNGVWVVCPDKTVRTLAERRPPMFLYFGRHAYDVAVAKLSPTQTQEVVRLRRDRWAPKASAYALGWLLEVERASLEGALAAPDLPPAYIEESLKVLQRLYGLERYEMVSARAMAVTVLQGESLLLASLKSALGSGIFDQTPDQRQALSAHRDRRQVLIQATAKVLVAMGAHEYANTLPFADPVRGVFLHPADTAFERALSKTGEPVKRWRDGVVLVSAERRLGSLREQGFSVEILYADASDLYGSFEALTAAQLNRDFAERLQRSPAETRQDYLGQIDRLHLHQIVMKRELCARADATSACAAANFADSLREDVELLGRSLARSRSFGQDLGLDAQAPPRAQFRTAADLVAADLSLFAFIAARFWPAILPKLKEIETLRAVTPPPADVPPHG